jgi:hypothetical protein
VLRRFLATWRSILVVSPFAALLSLLLIASVALNVALAMRLQRDAARRTTPNVQGLATGQAVAALVGEVRVGAETRPQRYEPRGTQGTLIYFSAAQCKWSQQNLPTFIEYARQAQGRYRIVAVDLTPDLKKDQASHLDSVPADLVLRNLTPESRQAARVLGTPETLLLSPDGKVLRVWLGAYVSDDTKRELSSYLSGTPASPR